MTNPDKSNALLLQLSTYKSHKRRNKMELRKLISRSKGKSSQVINKTNTSGSNQQMIHFENNNQNIVFNLHKAGTYQINCNLEAP